MLLEIRHLTQYRYSAPVRESMMELWVQPQKSGQRLISFDLELDPAAQLFSYADAFGNAVYHFDAPQPHESLTIRAHALVETKASDPLPDALDTGEWDRLRSEFVQGECFDFLQPHGHTASTPALAAFVSAFELDKPRAFDPLTAVRRLSQTLYEGLEYAPGVTRFDSPIDEALEAGRGVCQDFAHIMLAVCRGWGVPARYVSGYLFNDPSEGGDRSDPGATHAWVEVYLPSLRWVGFDPTNNTPTGERHVIVAVGRDYDDVPPARGIFKGDAESELLVDVAVRQTRSAAADPEFLRTGRPVISGPARRRIAAAALEQQQLLEQRQQQQ